MIISSQDTKTAILAALADKDVTKILNAVMLRSKSVNTIMREQNIPYTTVYRKTKWLLNKGLLVVDKIEITSGGKKSSLVHATLQSIAVKYEQDGTIIIEAEENLNALKRVMKKFFSME
jgi:predicted transcriptional regulator